MSNLYFDEIYPIRLYKNMGIQCGLGTRSSSTPWDYNTSITINLSYMGKLLSPNNIDLNILVILCKFNNQGGVI